MRWCLLLVVAVAACGRLRFDSLGGDAGGPDGSRDLDANNAPNYAFITSTSTTLDTVQGLAGADAICNARAVAGGIPGNYVAWASTSTMNAKDRLAGARGWVRRDGKPFADQVSDIVAGKILYPLRVDELGGETTVSSVVAFTATKADGTLESNGSCSDLMSTTGGVRMGYAVGGTDIWTDGMSGLCSNPMRFYCFETDRDAQVTVPPANAKLAFVSHPFVPSGGLTAIDGICTTDANMNGHPGQYLAFMATTSSSPLQRFTPGPYARPDGVILTTDLMTSIASVTQRADGSYSDAGVWTGTTAPNLVGGAGFTCVDWTSGANGDLGSLGESSYSSNEAIYLGAQGCGSLFSAYCFEQ